VDREDLACGLFPVIYTPGGLAYSSGPTLPNVANVALIALSYSRISSDAAAQKLRCWALAQVRFSTTAPWAMGLEVTGEGKLGGRFLKPRYLDVPVH
jgi:hypothetical protein